MGRKNNDRVRINVYLPRSTKDLIDKLSEDSHSATLSSIVRDAVEAYLASEVKDGELTRRYGGHSAYAGSGAGERAA